MTISQDVGWAASDGSWCSISISCMAGLTPGVHHIHRVRAPRLWKTLRETTGDSRAGTPRLHLSGEKEIGGPRTLLRCSLDFVQNHREDPNRRP